MRASTGVVLGGRYRLTEPIAGGGMGEVWEAHDDLLGRTVAVKVLREELVSEAGFLARFRTEARNSARLAHPAIATTYDYGESEGTAWLVMELVPGEPLSDTLAREGALEPRWAMRLLARAATGLAAAHAAGIVHRDVKPGNLLLTPDGAVKVTDFGIARAAAEAPLTATGQVMGTAAYLSPEQATGRRDLTPAVDVYALGVVAHELLAGERPFTGESQVAIALAQVNDPPPPLPRWVPASARELVAACLAKDPRDRPADAGVFAEVASRIADGDDAGAEAVLAAPVPGSTDGGVAGGATAVGDATVVALPATSVLPPERATPAPGATAATAAGWSAAAAMGGGAAQAGAAQAGGGLPWEDPAATTPRGGVPPRRRLTVPLLGLLAVLVVIAVVLALSLGHRSSGTTPSTGTTPSATDRPSASARPSATASAPSSKAVVPPVSSAPAISASTSAPAPSATTSSAPASPTPSATSSAAPTSTSAPSSAAPSTATATASPSAPPSASDTATGAGALTLGEGPQAGSDDDEVGE